MNGVESSTSTVRMVCAVSGRGDVRKFADSLRLDPLASTRERVKQALGGDGYVEITGPLQENFEVYLTRRPVEMAIEDLKPGLLKDIAAWAASVIAGEPEQALQGQAFIQPRAAMKLLI
jgi:hypothetical protein